MSDDLNDIQMFVHDKTMQNIGPIGDPTSLTGTVRDSRSGALTLALSADHPLTGDLLTPGARVVCRLRGVGEFSGPVTSAKGKLRKGQDVTYSITTDHMLLDNLAWVAPGNPIAPTSISGTDGARTAQATYPGGGADAGADGTVVNQYGYTMWPTSITSAEGAIKWLLRTNLIDRLGLTNVTIAPDQGRGGDPTTYLPSLRFAALSEGVQPILDASGLSLIVLQNPGTTTITIDVRSNITWAAPLTVESGIVDDGEWTLAGPTVTRGVLGGPGEDAARAFFAFVNASGLEAQYGYVREIFRDSTGANLKWPSTLADTYKIAKYYLLRSEVATSDKNALRTYMTAEANKALLDGVPTSGVSTDLNETSAFHYGGVEGIALGTRVSIMSEAQQVYTDKITEADISYTRSSGLVVTPVVGARSGDATRSLAQAIGRLARAQVRLSTSR